MFAFFVYKLLQTKVWLTTNPEGFATIQLPQKNNPSFAKLVRRVNNIEVKKESIFCFEAKPPKKYLPTLKTKQKTSGNFFCFVQIHQQAEVF